jgi:hypothetical protein
VSHTVVHRHQSISTNLFLCLQDHRNASLRDWLINDFTLGNISGLGNPAIDGFYFDDRWSAAPSTPPPAGKWRGCSASPVGGASEEDSYCSIDMGLTKEDVAEIASNWSLTGDKVKAAVLANGGFGWGAYSMFKSEGARVESKPAGEYPGGYLPQDKTRCLGDMRSACVPNSGWAEGAFLLELSRKTFQDPFPLPFVTQDVAQFLLMR